MKLTFTKQANGSYKAKRIDNTVVTIEKTDYTENGMQWRSSYEGDFNGDNTSFAATKRELVQMENRLN